MMKARNPVDKQWYFFVDKCVPFGASISCSHFQRVSNAINHIFCMQNDTESNNNLHDVLLIASLEAWCNTLLEHFLELCGEINFPIYMDKT